MVSPPITSISVDYSPFFGNMEVLHADIFVSKLPVQRVTRRGGLEATRETQIVGDICAQF